MMSILSKHEIGLVNLTPPSPLRRGGNIPHLGGSSCLFRLVPIRQSEKVHPEGQGGTTGYNGIATPFGSSQGSQ